jgi:hypothetical protein
MQTRLGCLAAITTLVLSASTNARAGEVHTPLVSRSDAQDQGLACSVVNLGDKAIGPVTIRIFDESGAAARTVTLAELRPGRPGGLAALDSHLFGLLGHCRVEGKGVSKRTTPVTLCVIPETDFNCLAAVTSP